MFSCVPLFEVIVSHFSPSKYLYLPCTSQMSAKETQRFCKEPDVKIHYPGRHLQENECCVKIAAKVAQIASENLTNHRCSRNRRHALMGSFLRDLSSKQTSRIASEKQLKLKCGDCDSITQIIFRYILSLFQHRSYTIIILSYWIYATREFKHSHRPTEATWQFLTNQSVNLSFKFFLKYRLQDVPEKVN